MTFTGFPVHPVTLSIRLSPNRQWVGILKGFYHYSASPNY
jgi:hypothetical protein